MTRRTRPAWVFAGLAALAGCVPGEPGLMTVAADPFAPAPDLQAAFRKVPVPAASEQAAQRALRVGARVVAANPDIAVRPVISTVGAPHCEIFHEGTATVYLTEGLIRKCETDGQLAAVLCHELGKMAAEREAQAGPGVRFPATEPPPEVRVGNEGGGAFGPADGTRFVEMVKYDQGRLKPDQPAPPPPDPAVLARKWLERAGYDAGEQTAVAGVLREAQESGVLEKQMRGR